MQEEAEAEAAFRQAKKQAGTFSQNYGRLLTLILALYSPTVLMLVRQAVMLFRTLVKMGKLVLVYEAYPLELEAQLWREMSPECDFSVGTVVF